MPRIAHIATWLGVIAIPAVGWFVQDWSGATTLAVYWFETLALCLLVIARIALHQRWTPRRGHFRYRAPSTARRSAPTSSFISGFALVSIGFSAAHGVFLGIIVLLLTANGHHDLIDLDWRSVGFGCLGVMLFLLLDFVLDLLSLRQWSFWQVEQTANRGLSRVVVVHLTLIFGMVGIAVTDAPTALFSAFVVLKSLSALSFAVPQWEPKEPPKWLSRAMNRAPNVHPGESFEEFWVQDRTDESARRAANEQPWPTSRP
ncbi:hypothetical protein A5727_20565 [Mycobacterium sp. ACS4331]|nr:hypothetical protein A5727_20565 [Mycobacterium sp. ACS4331]